MENEKILHVITQTEWGGAQKYVYELVTSPEAINYDITVAVGKNRDKTLIDKLRAKNVKVIELKRLIRPISPINDVLAVFELKKLLQELKPDVIHTSSSKPSILGAYAFKLSGLKNSKLIHTVHGWAFNENISALKKKTYLVTEKLTAKYKTKFIFLSEFDRKSAKQNKIKINDSVIIYNGIDPDKINFLDKTKAQKELFKNYQSDFFPTPPSSPPASSAGQALGQGGIIVGTIANFYKTKGLEYFIGAINLLVKENKNIVGAVIGEGELRPELENLIANYNLKNNFLFLGSKPEASKYLKAFDVYVCSSVKEGVPYSILEAMTAELPIISTNVGGIPEIIENTKEGLLINPGNAIELVKAIKTIINNSDYGQQLAEQAKQKVKLKFSQAKTINETFNQYNN